MTIKLQEIVSQYLDEFNESRAQPIDQFLSQYEDLPIEAASRLRKMLKTLVRLNKLTTEDKEYLTSLSEIPSLTRLEDGSRFTPVSHLVAITRGTTVGESLTQVLENDPTELERFRIPQDILQEMSKDDKPLDDVQVGAEQRLHFAKSYASNDSLLIMQIVGLITHLFHRSRTILSTSSNSLAFTRPAPDDHEKH